MHDYPECNGVILLKLFINYEIRHTTANNKLSIANIRGLFGKYVDKAHA